MDLDGQTTAELQRVTASVAGFTADFGLEPLWEGKPENILIVTIMIIEVTVCRMGIIMDNY